MGNCVNPKTPNKSATPSPSTSSSALTKQNSKISAFSPQGKKIRKQLSINQIAPLVSVSRKLSIGVNSFWLSECVIPGHDLAEDIPKECQDICFSLSTDRSLLMTLMDGHGDSGKEVVDHSRAYIESQGSLLSDLESSPESTLSGLFQGCDEELRAYWTDVDALESGTTAVSVFISENFICAASVGDSRAVISKQEADGNNSVQADSPVLQLTEDHRPDLEHERLRILKSGGIIKRLADRRGSFGPLRVWHPSNPNLALAMSRSLGDSIITKSGVIAEPYIFKIPRNNKHRFIILASDGLWDVFDNLEAVSFVEENRNLCRKDMKSYSDNFVCPSSTNIAHLLCEEARFRWQLKNLERPVVRDDISCMILEFN